MSSLRLMRTVVICVYCCLFVLIGQRSPDCLLLPSTFVPHGLEAQVVHNQRPLNEGPRAWPLELGQYASCRQQALCQAFVERKAFLQDNPDAVSILVQRIEDDVVFKRHDHAGDDKG